MVARSRTILSGRLQRALGQRTIGIPDYPSLPPPQARTGRGNYKRTQRTPRDLQVTISAAEKPVRVLYGHQQVGAEIVYIGKGVGTGRWVFQLRWCWGQISAVNSILLGGNPLPGSAIVTHYLGTTSQLVDPTLAGMISGYTDTLVASLAGKQKGIAYSVVQIPWRDMPDSVEFTGDLNALMVADSSQPPGVYYTTNPALQYADFITDEIYGAGWFVDDASVQAQKAICDEDILGQKRSEAHISIDNPADISDHFAVFNSAALCFLVPDMTGGGVKMVPNRPQAFQETFDLRSVAVEGTINTQPINRLNEPNAVRVHYTNTSVQPWTEAPALDATVPYYTGQEYPRIAEIRAPYIHNHEQAIRLAQETLRAATLPRFNSNWLHRDDGVRIERGDVIRLDKIPWFPGFSDVRVLRRNLENSNGVWYWRIYARFYDSNEYSDDAIGRGVPPGIAVDDPTKPLVPGNLNLTESPFLDAGGTYQTVITATWDGVDHAQIRAYRVLFANNISGQVINNFNVQHTGVGDTHSGTSSPVKPGEVYRVEVRSISNTGQSSDASTATITATGDALGPPPDVGPVTLSERLWIDQMGATISALKVEWAGSADPWVRSYRVHVIANGKLILEQPVNHIASGFTHEAEISTVEKGVEHTAQVWAFNVENDKSVNASIANLTPQGRVTLPPDVIGLAVSEYSEYVELTWTNVLGAGDTAHLIRRGNQADTWVTANQLKRTEYMSPSSRGEPVVVYRDNNVQAGPVRYFVKAVAYEGLESANAAQIDVTISEGKGSTALDRPRIPIYVEPFPSLPANFDGTFLINAQILSTSRVLITNQDAWQNIFSVEGQRGVITLCAVATFTNQWTSGTAKIGGRLTIDGRTIWETYNELVIPDANSYITYVPVGMLWVSPEDAGNWDLLDVAHDYFPFNSQLKLEVYSWAPQPSDLIMYVGYAHQIT